MDYRNTATFMQINLDSVHDPNKIRELVLEAFRYKCGRCRRETAVVHEIEFKSQRPSDWWYFNNRIPLCIECHEWAHKNPKISGKILKDYREQRLREYGVRFT